MFMKVSWIKKGHESLNARTSAGKVLWYEAFSITKDHLLDGYHCVMPSVVYEFPDKKSWVIEWQTML